MGLVFDDPEDEETWYKDDEAINRKLEERMVAQETALGRELSEEEEAEIAQEVINEGRRLIDGVASRYNNRSKLRALAATIAMIDAVNEERGATTEPIPNFKKRLQAQHIVNGDGKPWVEVIERELPGEGLKITDTDLLVEVAVETIASGEESRLRFESRKSQMIDLLKQEGVDELTQDAAIAIIRLCQLRSAAEDRQSMQPTQKSSSYIEEARKVLADYDLTDPAWYKLIDIFFNVM